MDGARGKQGKGSWWRQNRLSEAVEAFAAMRGRGRVGWTRDNLHGLPLHGGEWCSGWCVLDGSARGSLDQDDDGMRPTFGMIEQPL